MTLVNSLERRYALPVTAHVALAALWVELTGIFALVNFAFGLVIAVGALWLSPVSAPMTWLPVAGLVRRASKTVQLGLFFGYELLLANMRMAADILRPRLQLRPGIVAIPLDLERDSEITLLANMITLTPGTLSLDVSQDRRTLYVHVVNIGHNADSVRRMIKQSYERRVLEVMR